MSVATKLNPHLESVTPIELAKILGISRQTVFNFEKDGILRRSFDGKSFNLAENVQAYIEHKTTGSDANLSDASLIESKRRKEAALAELQELNLAEKKNEIIDRQTVVNDVSKILTAFKSKLLNLSGKLSAEVLNIKSRAVAQSILEHNFKEVLEELSSLETYTDEKFRN